LFHKIDVLKQITFKLLLHSHLTLIKPIFASFSAQICVHCVISAPSITAHILQIRRVPNSILKQRQAPLPSLELGMLRRDEMILRVGHQPQNCAGGVANPGDIGGGAVGIPGIADRATIGGDVAQVIFQAYSL
jgi:hypothetical protein